MNYFLYIFRFEKFEITMVNSAEQIRKYEELFKKKDFKVADILYQAWLMFKLDSIGSEQEAFNLVLKKKKPANLQPKKKRVKVAPEGSAKYHMNDPKWIPIFEDRMEKEARTKKNSNNNSSKQGRSRSDALSTVTSGVVESNSSVPSFQLPSILAPLIDDRNGKSSSLPKKPTVPSCTMTSGALDMDSELPDIPEPTLSNSLLVVTSQSNRGKRKRGSITSSKRAKLRSNGKEVSGTVTSTSVPTFPLENGLVPLINDDDTEETSFDFTNVAVSKSKTTFLDTDLDLDSNIKMLNIPREGQSVSMVSEIVNNNNSSNSKSTRASGRLMSRGKSELSSDKLTSKLSLSAFPAHNNKKGIVRSKGISAASQSTVPITIIENGEEIMDQKSSNEISDKKSTIKVKKVKRVKK